MPNLEHDRWYRTVVSNLNSDFIPIRSAFSSEDKGFCLNGTHFISTKDSYEHVLLVGSTGSGKSTKIFIPSITRLKGSLIIHDPSKELLEITEKALLNEGFQVQVLNFSEPGAGYNPLLHIKEDSDLHLLSDLLVRAGRVVKPSDEHWLSRASELIAALIHLVLQIEDVPTLVKVHEYLLDTITNPESVNQLFTAHANLNFQKSFAALTKNQTNELSSIFSTAADALKDFSNLNIANVTSRNDIELNNLRSQKTALFIQNSPNRSHLYNKIISVFFEQLWLEMMIIPQGSDFDLYLLLDEFASLYLPTLPHKIDKVRKYRIGFLLAIQSLQQLRKAYSEDAITITDNCKTHIYLGAQKGDTALEIEKTLGKEGDKYRMPREKCRMLSTETTLILSNGKAPILTKNVPYFQNPDLAHLMDESDNFQNSASEKDFHEKEKEFESVDYDFTSEVENTVDEIYYM